MQSSPVIERARDPKHQGWLPRDASDVGTGEAATRYNVLQKLAYLSVIFVLVPLAILMGLAMSPWMDTVLPGWVDLFGGRQSARTIHFVVAWLLVVFVLIHVFEVMVTGLWNNLRSMLTGRYRVPAERPE